MKYIRKDNRIYEVKIKDHFVFWKEKIHGFNIPFEFSISIDGAKENYKFADTIEELCDGFVFKDTCVNELHLVNQNDGISMLGAALFQETLRGFIETDTGLIYVAKMNDKGELELI